MSTVEAKWHLRKKWYSLGLISNVSVDVAELLDDLTSQITNISVLIYGKCHIFYFEVILEN